jgi:hypothetical protein
MKTILILVILVTGILLHPIMYIGMMSLLIQIQIMVAQVMVLVVAVDF